MDRFERINIVYQQAVTQGQRARDTGRGRVDYLADRKNLDESEFIAEQFRKLEGQRNVVKTEGNPEGLNLDYLKQRESLDSLHNINRAIGNS